MPQGPQEARLSRAVAGAARASIQAAEQEWRRGAQSLDNVATALETAGPQVVANFGGTHTGPAAQRAFQQVAEKVRARTQQMERAADALANADVALGEAEKVHASLGALPSEPSRPDIAPGTNDADAVRQQRAYTSQLGSYHAAMADREAKAEAAANDMDRVYRQSSATMEQVHGEPGSRGTGGSGSVGAGGTGAAGATGGSSAGGTTAGTTTDGTAGTTGAPAAQHGGHTTPGTTAGGTHVVAPPGATPPVITGPGTAQGGVALPPVTSAPAALGATETAPAPSASGAGAAGGLAGALGGGLVGGAAGIGGSVRGGGAAAVSGARATAGRSLGATTRAAPTGALGRTASGATTGSTAATSRTAATARAAGPGATTGRGGAVGSTPQARPGGRGVAGSAGTAGGRGGAAQAAGTRPGARGAGVAAGRGTANDDDDRTERRDLFESPQEWVDDEDAAPGVID